MAIFTDPEFLLSMLCLFFNVAVLAVLYIKLPKTEKTSYVRYILRFAIIWALGATGARYAAVESGDLGVIALISELVILLGMVPLSAIWVHLAWQSTLELKDHDGKKAIMRIQLAVYIMAAIFVVLNILQRDGNDLTTPIGVLMFRGWFLACLGWSTYRFMGPDYDGSPNIERRYRQLLASGSMVMFMLVLIDLLQTLTLRSGPDISTGLNFGPMALLGFAFLSKARFIVPPAQKTGTPKDRRTSSGGITLAPGKVHVDLDNQSTMAQDVLRAQTRRGRPALVITYKDPERYRRAPGLSDIPIVRFASKEWDDPKGLDTTSEDVLEMVPVMIKEFALEAWERDTSSSKDTGSVVIIDGIHVLARVAGRGPTKSLAKELRKAVRGSDLLRVVLVGDRTSLGSMARAFTKSSRAIKMP